MRLSELLVPELVFPAVIAPRKEDALALVISPLCARYPELDRRRLTTALFARERLMSTALADGVAIPHARLAGLARMIAAFGRSRTGIEWGAQDGRPTELFFVLLVPDDAQGEHLKLLAHAARLLRDAACRARLMEAPDEKLLETLRAEEQRATGTANGMALVVGGARRA
jgi:PTS system nitrogen regulatory IIA component